MAMLGAAIPGYAQIPVPSLVTPPSLRPSFGPQPESLPRVTRQAPGRPADSAQLDVLIADVNVVGSFEALAVPTERRVMALRGRRITVAEIYALAQELEQLYAGSDYRLVRVVVPPQKLVDNGSLTLVVVDGFIEDIDTTVVPARLRPAVRRRLDALIGQRHLRQSRIERALLLAGDLPGLRLTSTLVRGKREGGVKLVLEGTHRLVTASIGADNRLSSSLGGWQLRGGVALNGAFGAGEQIYVSLGSGIDLSGIGTRTAPLQIVGGGVVLPLGNDGATLNPEYTRSLTSGARQAAVPGSSGDFERFALRLREPILLTRSASLSAYASLEHVQQTVRLPDFDTTLNSDRYAALRLGFDYAAIFGSARGELSGSVSQGLGGRSVTEAMTSGVPLSRIGASPGFTKVTGSMGLSQPVMAGARVDLLGFAQLTGGKSMLRSEQFALDGAGAVSAFPSGTLNADEGATARVELVRPFDMRGGTDVATLSPYIFAAGGRGWLAEPTIVEPSAFSAGALGIGLRAIGIASTSMPGRTFALELGRQFTDMPGLRAAWRGNVNVGMTF
jgi:hemolysin activation/secretion protein